MAFFFFLNPMKSQIKDKAAIKRPLHTHTQVSKYNLVSIFYLTRDTECEQQGAPVAYSVKLDQLC